MGKLWQKIKTWYEGEYIPYENDPADSIVFLGGYYERPWLARAFDAVVAFCKQHWQWLIATMVAIIGIIVAALRK